MIDSEDGNVRNTAILTIENIIIPGLDGIKEGDQHPYRKQLQSDGTIPKLIKFIEDKEKYQYQRRQTINILFVLFKAYPLPPEFSSQIQDIKQFFISQLTLVAECPDNHETILANNFENKFFEDESIPLLYLNLALMLFKYGSKENKQKVAFAIKNKVKGLTNFGFIDQMANSYNWDEEMKQNIKLKVQELKPIIEVIAGKFINPFQAPLLKIRAPQFPQTGGFNQAGQMGRRINPALQLKSPIVTTPKMKLLTKEEEASKHYICELSNQIMTDPV
ncbi:MAG: hypothetical protein EZS28_031989, partial [Streblomastix strix]